MNASRRFLISTAVAAGLLAAATIAQTASYTKFGQGCAGSANSHCKSNNGSATSLAVIFFTRTSEIALEVKGGANTPLVRGFEILTKARIKATVKAHVYMADATGRPLATPARSGTLTVDTKLGWYRATLDKPLLVKPGNTFFLSWTEPRVPFSLSFDWPVASSGQKSVFYWRPGNSGAWTGGPSTQWAWAWRVNCVSTRGSVPTLSNTGLPVLGRRFSVDLSRALGATPALLVIGSSKTKWGAFVLPLDLTRAGAPGCSLRASYDIPLGTLTSIAGTASFSLPVPGDTRFLGIQFHNQWVVVDPSVNALGLAFSDGGTATMGR